MKSFSEFLIESATSDDNIDRFVSLLKTRIKVSSKINRDINGKFTNVKVITDSTYNHGKHVCRITATVKSVKLGLEDFANMLGQILKGKVSEHSRYNTYLIQFNRRNVPFNKCLVTDRDYGSRIEYIIELCDDYGYKQIAE